MIKIKPFIKTLVVLQIVGLCFGFTRIETSTVSFMPKNSIKTEKSSDLMMMENADLQEEQFLNRMLEEQANEKKQQNLASDKISLSMGNVLSSLNIDVNAIVLSKDKKTAFVTLDFYGTLKVIDISNMQTPFIVSSVSLKPSGYEYKIKSLILSSDEKTLYASNSRDLEIIDVSYFGAPKLVSSTASEVFDEEMSSRVPKYFKTSLALDEKTMTLFIGGIGLQIYNVSNSQSPVLLKAAVKELDDLDTRKRSMFFRNEICLSPDGQFLLVANGTLGVYNISNPMDIQPVRVSIQTKSSPRSIFLYQNSTKALLLGTSPGDFRIILEEVDISDPKSPKIIETHNINFQSTYAPRIVAVSPSKNKIFILTDEDYDGYDLLVFDLQKKTTTRNQKSLIDSTQAMAFSDDGKYLIAGAYSQFIIVELFFNYPNKEIFSGSPLEMISNFSRPSSVHHMRLSSDGNFLYLIRSPRKEQSFDSIGVFEIFDVKNTSEPKFVGSYIGEEVFSSMYLKNNENIVYLIGQTTLSVLDLSNKAFPTLRKSFHSSSEGSLLQIVTTSDERTGIITRAQSPNAAFVTILDLSAEQSEIKEIITWEKNLTNTRCKMLLLDDNTLLIIDKELAIFDITSIETPKLIGLALGSTEPDPNINSFVLSGDRKTLYVETYNRNEFNKLRIYDISDLRIPVLLAEKALSKFRALVLFKPEFSLSNNLQTGYVFQESTLVKMNLKDRAQPRVSGVIPLSQNASERITNYLISPDGQKIFVIVDGYTVRIMNLNIKHSIFLKQDQFKLGEKYTDNIAMLKLFEGSDGGNDYDLMNTSAYKIIKLSIMNLKIAPNKYSLDVGTSLLPSWLTFDRESNLLSLEPKKQRDLGAWILNSRFSLKIPGDIFDDLGVNSEDLLAWLISLDFVDNQLYLTSNFGTNDTFYLPAQFSEHKAQIYNTLRKFNVETSTTFEIVPSLELKSDYDKLLISTLSAGIIRVEIRLEPRELAEVKFLNKPYAALFPAIKDAQKTQVSFEGELKDVNAALASIVVNFENGSSCDAILTINDGLNPAVAKIVNDISRYFKSNIAPVENKDDGKTVQDQINQAVTETGKFFSFSWTEDTFLDDYAESLTFEIAAGQNGTALPAWLSLSGLTLKGTPPEEFFGREVELILIARNEFKHVEVPFKIHIRVSTVFILKLLLRYSPYILTLVGLFVSANKIFNIVGKKYYKHPKEFFVHVGEEVGDGVIFPVAFIKDENRQSEMVFKEMRRRIPKRDLPEYFVDGESRTLNREKIVDKIQEAIYNMPADQRTLISPDRRALMEQIIFNRFVNLQINSKIEVNTKSLFEDLMKADCLEVVEYDPCCDKFIINSRKLNSLMQRFPTGTSRNLEETLISHNGENMNLLKDAILAFAFEKHSLDMLAVSVNISVKQLVKSTFCWSFLKLDLKEIFFNDNNKIDYGINYRIEDDKLCFYGVPKRNLKDKTLVVQIKNKSHKILKEIWIHGFGSRNDGVEGDALLHQDESVARGQGYEIF